jgi:hypothetical protein
MVPRRHASRLRNIVPKALSLFHTRNLALRASQTYFNSLPSVRPLCSLQSSQPLVRGARTFPLLVSEVVGLKVRSRVKGREKEHRASRTGQRILAENQTTKRRGHGSTPPQGIYFIKRRKGRKTSTSVKK